MSRGKAILSLTLGTVVVAIAILLVLRCGASTSNSPPLASHPAEDLEVTSSGDRSAQTVPSALNDAVRNAIAQIDSTDPPESQRELADRAVSLISASIPEDFASLEALMHRLGGNYFATASDNEIARRWWRSVPKSKRPEFAAEMSDNQWERWIDRAGTPELARLPEDTRAPIRAIDRERIQSASFDTLDPQMPASIDATLRAIAKDKGFANADSARIIPYRGRLRYRPAVDEEPQPSKFAVVFVPGITTDERDFVAAYIFGYREPTGWFPYFVRSLSQHRETTPPQRRIPFVPAF